MSIASDSVQLVLIFVAEFYGFLWFYGRVYGRYNELDNYGSWGL